MIRKIAKTILVFAFIGIGLYFWLILPLDWKEVSSKETPGGEIIAYHLQSGSEAGEAPYGYHFILAPGIGHLEDIMVKLFLQGIVWVIPSINGSIPVT